ncbi:MAG: translation initiation factor IF-2 N-terminal domain-containing protein, partial [Thermoanaerobaculia bacterium]
MAAAKIRVSDIAKKMGKSEKDVLFQLQSLGADITEASQELGPEVIQALLTGKKLVARTKSVIMREDKPVEVKKKEAVRPPRPIVQPPVRKKTEAPKEEPIAAQQPPAVIIPEFVEAAEAEERAAKEAPQAPEKHPKIAAEAPAAAAPVAEEPTAPPAEVEAPAPVAPPAAAHP